MKKGKIATLIASLLAMTSLSGCNQQTGYTIIWTNSDGTLLEIDKNVKQGTLPRYDGETPKKAEDKQYRYEFLNWYTAVEPATKDVTYVAQYYKVPKDAALSIDPVDLAIKAGKALIENFVPHGKQILAVVTSIIDCFKKDDKGKEVSLKDIKEEIAALRTELKSQYNEIEKQLESLSEQQRQIEQKLETIIVSQTTISQKGTNFDTLLTSLEATARQISVIENDDTLSDQDKAVQLALLFGRNDKWVESSNLYNQYLNFLDTVTGQSFGDIKGKDLFTLVYDEYLTNSMFTGEAKYSTEVYVSQVVYLALYAYSICAECLKAAEEVSSFTTEDLAKLNNTDRTYYDNNEVATLYSIISEETAYLNSKVFQLGFDQTSFADRMQAFNDDDLNRHIYTNCGTKNITLKDEILRRKYDGNGQLTKDGSAYDDWNPETYINNLDNNSEFGADARRQIAEHAKASFPGTMRQYLMALGYNLAAIPQHAYYYISMKEKTESLGGYEDMFTIGVEGIDIDDKDYVLNDLAPFAKYKLNVIHGTMENVPVDAGCFIALINA